MGYKFAFDLGSTSCGWAVVKTDENQNVIDFEDMGVRIFPDGRDDKTKQPLCVSRRDARTSRVRHDRILERKEKVINLLKENGMMFSDNDERKNPYQLRAEAVLKQISLSELGRVLFQLSLRRGFKSNRKEIKNDEGGKLKKATEELKQKLNNQTLGQFLWQKFEEDNKKGVKIRFSEQFIGTKIKDDSLYPTREMYEEEFEKIWAEQSKYYPVLTEDLKQKFYNAIFYQRPLKPQELGFCIFEDGQHRIYKAHPLFQKFRVLQTVNQLQIITGDTKQDLSKEQRNNLIEILLKTFDGVSNSKTAKGTISFTEIKKKLFPKELQKTIKFNIESDKRDKIYADITSFLMSKEECFGQKWFELPTWKQMRIVLMILSDKISDDRIKRYLSVYNLSENQIENILIQPLEEKIGSLSIKAIKKILPYLEQGQLYNDACKSAGYNHSDIDGDIKMLSQLPYYGDVLKKSCIRDKNGVYKITNVSVHIALNQLRFVVNELIRKYGNPDNIAIEVARDLKVGTKGLNDINNEQTKNKKENDRISSILTEAGCIKPTKDDILKYKLWENLAKNPEERRCIYSGKQISINDLLSGFVQIEHILPFSRTFDDSMANKTLSFADANYYKGNRTPYEAFHESKDGYDWDAILERAEKLPSNVRWRFDKDAMEKIGKDGGPIARALNDTRYMTKSAVSYLAHICKNPKYGVYGLPGQMTALMREIWGLNWFKNKEQDEMYRSSHIHHAIDAFTVACMTRGQLQQLSMNADKIEKLSENYKEAKSWRKRIVGETIDPFEGFNRSKFIEKCKNMIISYKPKLKNPKDTKSTVGALHEDTAYSLLDFEKKLNGIFVKRNLVSKLTVKDLSNIIDTYASKVLSEYGETEQALNEFKSYCDVNNKKKIRIKSVTDISTYIPIFRSKQERDEYHNVYENWYVFQGRSPLSETKQEKEIRKQKEDYLLLDLQNKAKKAYKWYVGGNNFCADIYQINPDDKVYTKDRGIWKTEIISNYMATLYKGEALWKKKYPKARRIMNLKINDMVVGEFRQDDINLPKGIKDLVIAKCISQYSDTTSVLFRVKKISSDGRVYLRPDFITKENADTKSWCASVSSFQTYKARKVYVSPAGELKDPGFNDKWSKQNDTEHN
ncbi:MAG: type II CRISPR RNA-guided endonuclease Cas9 [bacterium]|nr:type II CRISPR RNA-guided endonuclease Cas9 [bacterium]